MYLGNEQDWLALVIGNSRLHWGWFRQNTLIETWHTEHVKTSVRPWQLPHLFLHHKLIEQDTLNIPVYFASVVASQTEYWRNYHQLNRIDLLDINLAGMYPGMGIDRALTIYGAVSSYRQACLVIDGGTALTFTSVDEQGKLIGGAILPGLRSQLSALKHKTPALPEVKLPEHMPPRWALDTDTAIASGILYTAIAGVHSYIIDWLRQFPLSQVIFTGGDAELLSQFLHQQYRDLSYLTTVNHSLVFEGIRLVYEQQNGSLDSLIQ